MSVDLKSFSNAELDQLILDIEEERRQRLLHRLRTEKNLPVIALTAGFSSGEPGRLMYCVGEYVKGQPTGRKSYDGKQDVIAGHDYFSLSDRPDGESKWLVSPGEALRRIRAATKDEINEN